jgi:hypothetical protein
MERRIGGGREMRYGEMMNKVTDVVTKYAGNQFDHKAIYPFMQELKEVMKDIVDLSGWEFSHTTDFNDAWVKSKDNHILFNFKKSRSGKTVTTHVIDEGWMKVLPVDERLTRLTAKEHTINTLRKMIDIIEREDWQAFERETNTSHAGDGYGDDNIYIDFTPHRDPYHWHERYDIGDMANMIMSEQVFEEMEEENE